MKKTLVSALTTALVVGAASTTFAAVNPFTDVPSDHWAYDAVEQLRRDNVIDGMGDGTFQGARSITRYEMAQMVAKALARQDQVNASDKALIDKLAHEFSDELNNLGVRVSNLEQKVDNVKWTGELRYTYKRFSADYDKYDEGKDNSQTTNELQLRLFPTATVNDHWKVKARIDGTTDMSESNSGDLTLKWATAEAQYGRWTLDFGKFPVFSERGIVIDDFVSGGRAFYNSKKFTGELIGGRYRFDNNRSVASSDLDDRGGNYLSANLTFKPSDKFSFAAEYFRVSSPELYGSTQNMRDDDGNATAYNDDIMNIWGVGATYNFTPKVYLSGYYGNNTSGDQDSDYSHVYDVELGYGKANREDAGSFGIHAAYRYLGQAAVLAPTWDAAQAGLKGWEIGADYTFAPNIVGYLQYFRGKEVGEGGQDENVFFGRVKFFF